MDAMMMPGMKMMIPSMNRARIRIPGLANVTPNCASYSGLAAPIPGAIAPGAGGGAPPPAGGGALATGWGSPVHCEPSQ